MDISNNSDENNQKIIELLNKSYPDAHCELNFNTPFQLLIATILSAQSTDKTVNKVTEKLFKDYPTLEEFNNMNYDQLEKAIKQIGLYRNKAKNILSMCNELKNRFEGQVPSSMNELISLPGVGRKTANVVMSNAFEIPAIAVDTHVFRVSNRLGLANSKNVDDTEKQLMKAIPKNKWIDAHHWLIWHGRRTCSARNPKCNQCLLTSYCKFYISNSS